MYCVIGHEHMFIALKVIGESEINMEYSTRAYVCSSVILKSLYRVILQELIFFGLKSIGILDSSVHWYVGCSEIGA